MQDIHRLIQSNTDRFSKQSSAQIARRTLEQIKPTIPAEACDVLQPLVEAAVDHYRRAVQQRIRTAVRPVVTQPQQLARFAESAKQSADMQAMEVPARQRQAVRVASRSMDTVELRDYVARVRLWATLEVTLFDGSTTTWGQLTPDQILDVADELKSDLKHVEHRIDILGQQRSDLDNQIQFATRMAAEISEAGAPNVNAYLSQMYPADGSNKRRQKELVSAEQKALISA